MLLFVFRSWSGCGALQNYKYSLFIWTYVSFERHQWLYVNCEYAFHLRDISDYVLIVNMRLIWETSVIMWYILMKLSILLYDDWLWNCLLCSIIDVACVHEPCWYVEVYDWRMISSYHDVWSCYMLNANWGCVLCDNKPFYVIVWCLCCG